MIKNIYRLAKTIEIVELICVRFIYKIIIFIAYYEKKCKKKYYHEIMNVV